ncbi:MAG: bifunctional DNA-formamidopyrimidine glycosylase/DNA-(apurinic or apyrimidinic site) lyase [Anaerolineaceae bacterium]|nr:bifunctional DNA-formamidopyrimidine glycosylase/DNA-(apurinic or apyrimidinic site) lyase [Anaerolineaceae bacterium]
MPELPEVETIVNAMKSGGRGGSPLIGLTVQDILLLWPRTLAEPEDESALKILKNQKLVEIRRRGKFIVLQFSDDVVLIHLRMSGDIRVHQISSTNSIHGIVEKHDRFVIYFKEQVAMVFQDTRKFGRIWLVKTADQITGKLGPEPFDSNLSADVFLTMLHSYHRQIKPLLMDQTFIAGLGNIYTDESLFLAGIHPRTNSNEISQGKAKALLKSIRDVLGEGIHRNGSSIDWIYRGGDFQKYFKVYQRTGDACFICGQPIQRILVGQRGTHFCPQCQPEPVYDENRKE